MAYTVIYRMPGQGDTSEAWPGTFAEAKEQAIDTVASGVAERVEIRDANNQLVYHYPRSMSRAPGT